MGKEETISDSHRSSGFYADNFSEHFFPGDGNGGTGENSGGKRLSLAARYAISMARRPRVHLIVALVVSVVLSFLGLRFGEFEVVVDNAGWWSRGTTISDRASQELLVNRHRQELFFGDGSAWEELTTVIQPNWQRLANDEEEDYEEDEDSKEHQQKVERICSGEWYGSKEMWAASEDNLYAMWRTRDAESKQPADSALTKDALFDLCIAEESTLRTLEEGDLCYKCPSEGGDSEEKCILPYSLSYMARLYLIDNGYAAGNVTSLSTSTSCHQLRDAWTPSVQSDFTSLLQSCVSVALALASGEVTDTALLATCPYPQFRTTVVDEFFPTSDPPIVRYTSSFYATRSSAASIDAMFDSAQTSQFDGSSGDPLSGVYDTTSQSFYGKYSNSIITRDMSLAVGSAGVTVIAMVFHTQSLFLTIMGLLQILLSFPLAYFVYYFIGGLVFFPFLNFIGIFVVFALGADDVFVAVDKWKNARHELPHGTTEQVAALALPDAAYAMLLTSTTTAVAFFGTAICPVAPIVCFAVFCGLLITFDYLMNIFLVFPALCLYDSWLKRGSKNVCVSFQLCKRKEIESPIITTSDLDDGTNGVNGKDEACSKDTPEIDAKESSTVQMSVSVMNDSEEGQPEDQDSDLEQNRKQADKLVEQQPEDKANSAKAVENSLDAEKEERHELLEIEKRALIHRVLDSYYTFLHKFRYIILAITLAGSITCTVFAAKLSLPVSSEVSILPDSNPYQQHEVWSNKLLSSVLAKGEGSEALIMWGLTPADTGDHLNPDSFTTLVLDDTFDPRSQTSQNYLLEFCDRLFKNDFASEITDEYQCPMNSFNEWLADQSASTTPTDEYTTYCNNVDSVPVPSDTFDPCIIAWSQLVNETYVLQDKGVVKMMQVRTRSKVLHDSPFRELDHEWHAYESWLNGERSVAPPGVRNIYHSSIDFWWYDTNGQMLQTAYGAAGIALACAAVVVFISSRSLVLTVFAALSIGYVLVAATACLVGLGWELGFLESILFAILIGISCDFVIHLGHAYTMYPGSVSRHHRSHFALMHMGPSILAAAFTTFMAAVVMVFTEITFFQKFAVILFMTIIHSTLGSFVVFLVLCECIGPSEPTKFYDTTKAKLLGVCNRN